MPIGEHNSLVAWLDELPSWAKIGVVGGAALVLYIPYKVWTSRTRPSPYVENWKPDVVYLYQFPRIRRIPNASPFCLKLETWLRMSDVQYEIPEVPMSIRSKEGTLPFVELNGVEYHDSTFIIRDLDKMLPNHTSIDDHLSPEQKAASMAFEALIEKPLLLSSMVFRIENLDKLIDLLNPKDLGMLAPIVKPLVFNNFSKALVSKIDASDLGFHSRDERVRIGSDAIRALSDYLGTKHYLHGFKPTKVDASLFGILAQILYAPYDSDHKDVLIGECHNLVEFVERVKSRFWPDWDDVTTTYSTETNWKRRPLHRSNGKAH
ncbi:unnamed protein product [Caenorhabditis bovis]|uniref:Uncharacterized protein n=1 Tax=Caenorhabditis bovis TaxID=2654633 RepID=A0A8S1F142_9PELO|nr:unnamed protein product [Caenorhabditis bovis]